MAQPLRLDRKTWTAIILAGLLVLAGPVFVLAQLVVAKLHEGAVPIAYPHGEDVVRLPDRSTLLVKKDSTGDRVLDWLKFSTKGEHRITVGNGNFAKGSPTLTRGGWKQLVQFGQILKGYPSLHATILFGAHHGDTATIQLEYSRATKIRSELVKQGVREDQVSVAPEQLDRARNPAEEEGLRVVLARRA